MVYRYLALGDSLTVGIGALFGSGFVPLYRKRLENHLGSMVLVSNRGVNGLTSQGLLSMVKYNEHLRHLIKEADVITISIGGNDLIRAARSAKGNLLSPVLIETLESCEKHVSEIISQIQQLKKKSRPYFIRLVGLYNPLPQSEAAYLFVKQYNEFLMGFTSKNIAAAPLLHAFQGREREQLFIDHVHPSSKGYRVIVDQLTRLGFEPLISIGNVNVRRK
ncbi:GDSL-type esterase/lipase family protein [Paenibacillus provencensis]|uniref:GDSL-type esterase/lipase family protein n=1 Tax=Paenibacillus provencensis TaxID=441151 RepID=A0ABW3PW34_9BACL|nr:GDSL-type esterase/lipase family protein [Paenibacillus sp. MER 78]MCM3130309.1 GDSL-type esterase/lipase family protein [Paenibacillus sp. MER 78]